MIINQLSLFPEGTDFSCKDFNNPKWPVRNAKKYREGMTSFFGVDDPQRFVDGFMLALGKCAQPDISKLDNWIRQQHEIPSYAEISMNEIVQQKYGEAAYQWLQEILA